MENEATILSALQKGVTAAVAQSDLPSLPIKYLLKGFTVPQTQKWLEIIWIPNNRAGDFLGREKNHRGILRLVLHWPNTDTDVYKPTALLASIVRYFHKGRLLNGVQIYAAADPAGLIEEGDETLFPVVIMYQSYQSG